jgi:hypothetical protein
LVLARRQQPIRLQIVAPLRFVERFSISRSGTTFAWLRLGDRMLIDEIGEGAWAIIDGHLYVRPPGTPRAVFAPHHLVVHNEDGTITILPSVSYGKPGEPYWFHGWLTNGIWRDANGDIVSDDH